MAKNRKKEKKTKKKKNYENQTKQSTGNENDCSKPAVLHETSMEWNGIAAFSQSRDGKAIVFID